MDLNTAKWVIAAIVAVFVVGMLWFGAWSKKRERAQTLAEEKAAEFKESSQEYTRDLSRRIQFASDREDYESLQKELEENEESLAPITHFQLSQLVETCLRDIAKEEAEAKERALQRAELVPQLVEFRGLRSVEDSEVLFEALHRLLVTGEKTLHWETFCDYDGWGDEDWSLITGYEQLLNDKLRELYIAAHESTPEGCEAYQAAKLLQEAVIAAWGIDEFEQTIEDDVFVLWLEATALHSRRFDRKDLVNHEKLIYSLIEESMGEIARDSERGDLPSMQAAWMLLDEGNGDFEGVLLRGILARLGEEIDRKRASLGFVEEFLEEELVASA